MSMEVATMASSYKNETEKIIYNAVLKNHHEL